MFVYIFIPPGHVHYKMRGLVFLKRWFLGGHFLVPHEGPELACFSSKHFWHSLKKHIVGFQVVFKNR